jgi:hypothetical protein
VLAEVIGRVPAKVPEFGCYVLECRRTPDPWTASSLDNWELSS